MPKLFGLYDNDRQVSDVVGALSQLDLDEEAIHVINLQTISHVNNVALTGAMWAGQHAGDSLPKPMATMPAPGSSMSRTQLRSYLESQDVPAEEAEYYAQGLNEGGTMVLVDAPADSHDAAGAILREHDPQVTNAG